MTIKIGDRVRMTADYDGRKAETDGTVMKSTANGNFNVKFDAPFLGHGEDDRCWNVPASKLALVGFKVEVGKTYQMRDGGARGPIVAQEDFLTAGGMHYAENGECCYRGKSGDDAERAEDLVAEWIEPGAAAAAGFIVEAGKFYRDADGKKRGPMTGNTFKWEAGHAGAGDPEWNNNGRALKGDVNLIAEWVEPAADPVRYKVGDKVRMSDFSPDYAGKDVTISSFDDFDDALPYSVTIGDGDGDWRWVSAKDIVGPPAPAVAKVGDWVKDSEGDIGIVFHDDGDAECNLHVGFTVSGEWDTYSARSLTVVPAGTTKAANDNAPILAEIDALQARIDGLRASIA